MTLPIPSRPDAITPQWMTEALHVHHQGPEARVRALHRDVLTEDAGAMCEAVRCHLEYDPPTADGPRTVFVKYTGQHEANRAVARALQLYRREVWFYQQQWTSPALAHCYLARHDPDTDAVVVVLEDVAGAARTDSVRGFPTAEATAAVRALAAVHTGMWGRNDLPFPAVCAQGGVSIEASEASIERFGQAWSVMRERVGKFLAGADADWLVQFAERLTPDRQRTLLASMNAMPRTLIHGDLHADNILWRSDGAGCVLVDWQTCGAGPAVLDLAYFVSGHGAEPRHAPAILRAYHAALDPEVQAAYPWEQLVADYAWALPCILRYALLLGAAVDLRNQGLRMLYGSALARLTAAVQVLPAVP